MLENKSFELINQILKKNNVVLFMKGNADMPMCGFSAAVVNILKKLEIKFFDIDVLQNQDLRESVKIFSDWPTIPQLYIKEEFIGGSDIVKEMFDNGELMSLLKDKNIKYSAS